MPEQRGRNHRSAGPGKPPGSAPRRALPAPNAGCSCNTPPSRREMARLGSGRGRPRAPAPAAPPPYACGASAPAPEDKAAEVDPAPCLPPCAGPQGSLLHPRGLAGHQTGPPVPRSSAGREPVPADRTPALSPAPTHRRASCAAPGRRSRRPAPCAVRAPPPGAQPRGCSPSPGCPARTAGSVCRSSRGTPSHCRRRFVRPEASSLCRCHGRPAAGSPNPYHDRSAGVLLSRCGRPALSQPRSPARAGRSGRNTGVQTPRRRGRAIAGSGPAAGDPDRRHAAEPLSPTP